MRTRTILTGIGFTLLITAAAGASLAGGALTRPAVTAQSLPAATMPTATITATPAPLPRATTTITRQLPQATITVTKKVPQATTYLQCPGHTEDSCYPDYVGKGRWVLRVGERPMPKATKTVALRKHINKVPKATIYSGCRSPRLITRAMVADCIDLSKRPKRVDAQGNETPNGRALITECLASYTNARELGYCLGQ